MNRMFAIVEREMRKFFRSPALMLMSMMLPLVQLVILGNAFGGKVTNARMGVVDYDHGEQAVKIREAFAAVAANIRTFDTVTYDNEAQAREDVRTGKIDAAVVIPAQYSRRVLAGESPHIGLVVDNSDQFVSGSIESEMQSLVDALNAPLIQPKVVSSITLDIVELYPYIEYMKFLLSGSIALAMYISVMIGGGMLYIDDKARGVHEGYLVTPITRLGTGHGPQPCGSRQGGAGRRQPHCHRIAAGRPRRYLSSRRSPAAFSAYCGHIHRLQRHDVPADGARRRPAGARAPCSAC